MRRAPRPIFLLIRLSACLLVLVCVRPAGLGMLHAPNHPAATFEPALPLSISLEIEDEDRPDAPGLGLTPKLKFEYIAGSEIVDTSFAVTLPQGLTFAAGQRLPENSGRLRAGEHRTERIPLQIDGPGRYPVRVEAVVLLKDGRTFRVGHGRTFGVGVASPAGRLNNGAYEVPATRLDELGR